MCLGIFADGPRMDLGILADEPRMDLGIFASNQNQIPQQSLASMKTLLPIDEQKETRVTRIDDEVELCMHPPLCARVYLSTLH